MAHDRIYAKGNSKDESDVVIQWGSAERWHENENDGGQGYVTISMHRQTNGKEVVEAYGHFDRVALNRLIEKARRARKEAYGEDK